MRRAGLMAATLAVAASVSGVMVAAASAQEPGFSTATQRAIKEAQKTNKQTRQNDMRAILGGGIGSAYNQRRRAGYGWTNRHAQRVARAARNRIKHRARGKSKGRL